MRPLFQVSEKAFRLWTLGFSALGFGVEEVWVRNGRGVVEVSESSGCGLGLPKLGMCCWALVCFMVVRAQISETE